MKKFMSSLKKRLLKIFPIIFRPFLIPIMKRIALTGEGTENCLKHGFLPVAVHFYQPIPDIFDLERRNVWDRISKMRGIKFEPEKYIEFLKQLGSKFAGECDCPNEPSNNLNDFHLQE